MERAGTEADTNNGRACACECMHVRMCARIRICPGMCYKAYMPISTDILAFFGLQTLKDRRDTLCKKYFENIKADNPPNYVICCL